MTPVEIRPLRREDLDVLADLLTQLLEQAHGETAFAREHLEKLLLDMESKPDCYLNLVAVSSFRVVGFLSLLFYRSFFHRVGTAQINELIVDRARRGKGIGTRLVEAALAEARRRGMDEIELSTENDNTRAIEFYRSRGFDEEYLLLGRELDAGSPAPTHEETDG